MHSYNIYLRKDGRWEGRIPKPTENGIRKYKSFFGTSREEVMRKMDEFMEMNMGESEVSVSFKSIFKEWFQSVQYRIKESTAANYRMKADKHILPIFRDKSMTDLNESLVYEFIELKRSERLSDRYISDMITLMRSVCRYAAKKYSIQNPMADIRVCKRKTAEVRILEKEEHHKLNQYVIKQHNRSNLGILLAMTTGIRIGELCALQWADIDLEKRILTVRKTIQRIQCKDGKSKTKLIITEPKSESSKREIPLPECIISYLSEFIGKLEQYVLSGTEKPVEPRTMQNRFARILRNVNLPSVHFHSLRHYFASDCIRLGFDVKSLSELLGHGSVEITLNRYVHSSLEQKREYMNRISIAA